jgi:hypothetical protein
VSSGPNSCESTTNFQCYLRWGSRKFKSRVYGTFVMMVFLYYYIKVLTFPILSITGDWRER